MSNRASMRHLALIAIFAVAFTSLAVSAGHSAVRLGADGFVPVSWTSPDSHSDGGCGSDGDPDNPTVDRPASRGSTYPGEVERVERVDGPYGDGGGVVYWWTRLLQLIGI